MYLRGKDKELSNKNFFKFTYVKTLILTILF